MFCSEILMPFNVTGNHEHCKFIQWKLYYIKVHEKLTSEFANNLQYYDKLLRWDKKERYT